MRRIGIDWRSLHTQMLLSITGLVLLTASTIGGAAVWLIRSELDRQVWAQVEQGHKTVQALYTARQTELIALATLTAQRPTLFTFLQHQNGPDELPAYLNALQKGAGLDLMIICNAEGRVLAQTDPAYNLACINYSAYDFHLLKPQNGTPAQVWLLATHAILDNTDTKRGLVIVGLKMDDRFATQMRQQTGLEHSLLVNGQLTASSFNRQAQSARVVHPVFPGMDMAAQYAMAQYDHIPYFTFTFPLNAGKDEKPIEVSVALEVLEVMATRSRLNWTLLASIVLAVGAAAAVATVLTRQISRPLEQMAVAATALSHGDLNSPVAVNAHVREVALVAQALENARLDLRRTLTDLRREKAWTDLLLEAMVEGIVTLDHHGRITFFSPGAERITGWPRHEVLNRPCDDIFRPFETDIPFSKLIPSPGQRRKITVSLGNDHLVTLAVTGAQFTPPEIGSARVALVFRDVSEQEIVNQIMGHFLANIAHEFRTPLSAVAASTELLLDQAPSLTPAELQELLNSLHLGIVGLQTLVDNLLESASIEAGRFRVSARPANVSEIITEAMRTMQPLIDKHNQRLILDLPEAMPIVRADSRRTIQVLVNLLSNAIKYGPDNAEITLSAAVSPAFVRITVGDRGPGLLNKNRDDLFQRFSRYDSEADKSQYGAGLGLSVVKAVVEAQHGQVGVDDRPGGGLDFWFTLPVEQLP